ncbi:unnamed protein product [Diplocarpon coronariae]
MGSRSTEARRMDGGGSSAEHDGRLPSTRLAMRAISHGGQHHGTRGHMTRSITGTRRDERRLGRSMDGMRALVGADSPEVHERRRLLRMRQDVSLAVPARSSEGCPAALPSLLDEELARPEMRGRGIRAAQATGRHETCRGAESVGLCSWLVLVGANTRRAHLAAA